MLSQPEQVIVSEMVKLSENRESRLNGSSSAQGDLQK